MDALTKMWIALSSMFMMFGSLFFLYLSRYKLKGIFKTITALLAYILLIFAGLIIFFVVFSGPTNS